MTSIDGKTTTVCHKTIAKAVMDTQYEKTRVTDDRIYNTIDLKTNIDLENTKDFRAEQIRRARERKR